MPTLQIEQSIAANVTVNVLADKRIANLPPNAPSKVTLAATAAATGLEGEVFIGNRNPLEKGSLSIANRMPQIPEDVVFMNEPGMPGEKVVWNVQNTTAGALNFFGSIMVRPVPRRRR